MWAWPYARGRGQLHMGVAYFLWAWLDASGREYVKCVEPLLSMWPDCCSRRLDVGVASDIRA